MPTLARKIEVDPTIIDVKIEDHLMHVILADGREVGQAGANERKVTVCSKPLN